MSDQIPSSFRAYYERLYADKHSSLSTAEEAHVIVSAFVDYRRSLHLPCGPLNSRQGAKLIYKLIYHKRLMQAAEESQRNSCADQHWSAVLETWNCFLYAIYVDDACHPARTLSLAAGQRLKLWWRRTLAPKDALPVLPRRAWSMIWAVDLLRDQLMIGNRCVECERRE